MTREELETLMRAAGWELVAHQDKRTVLRKDGRYVQLIAERPLGRDMVTVHAL